MLWLLGQIFVARFLQGTLGSGDPQLSELFETPGWTPPTSPEIIPSRTMPLTFGAAMSVVLCETGRLDDARPHFELLMNSELEKLPQHDYAVLVIPAFATVACARLGDIASAKRLRAILEPHSHRLVGTSVAEVMDRRAEP